MIVLPTRRRLIRRRDALYDKLGHILRNASVMQVEAIMRQIHCINQRLLTYCINANEPKEVFHDEEDYT